MSAGEGSGSTQSPALAGLNSTRDDDALPQGYASPDESISSRERWLAAWEIASLSASTLIAEWVVFSVGGGSNLLLLIPVAFAFILMFYSQRVRGETARELGFRVDNFMRALRLLLPTMLLASLFLTGIGLLTGSQINFGRWRGGQSILGVPALGVLWGLMQQYALQAFINRRAQIIWGRGARSILFVALMFAALHLPNPWLTLATFAGGLLWAFVYQRAPNLLALALSHAIMTWVLVASVPPSALKGLRVGYKFFG